METLYIGLTISVLHIAIPTSAIGYVDIKHNLLTSNSLSAARRVDTTNRTTRDASKCSM
jgi:hypothetical protein